MKRKLKSGNAERLKGERSCGDARTEVRAPVGDPIERLRAWVEGMLKGWNAETLKCGKGKKPGKTLRRGAAETRRRRARASAVGAAVMSAVAALAALPYTLGDIALVIPSEWKPTVTGVSLAAAFVLRVLNSATINP